MNPLRVGIDISALDPAFKEHAQRGIGRYVRELKNFFDSRKSGGAEPVSVGYFDHTSFRAGPVLDGLIQCAPLGRETLRQQIVYPLKLRRGAEMGFDILHFPAQMDAPSWSPMPYLITVLDLIPIIHRDLYERANASWRFHLARRLELSAIRNARRVLVISENTGNDVHRLLGVPWERISVTPLGVNDLFFREISPAEIEKTAERYKLDRSRPSILYVGGIDQRKNWGFMLETVSELRALCVQAGRSVPRLIMAGRIDRDRQYPLLQSKIDELDLREVVHETGFVADEDLPAFYQCCSVFFFPSLYEGFGLPPLEALASGMPVLSSNTSAMPEVLGSWADYTSPDDKSGAVRKLSEILFERPNSPELSNNRRKQAAQFTWQRTGEKTLEAYDTWRRERLGQNPLPPSQPEQLR